MSRSTSVLAARLHYFHGIDYDISYLGPWYIYHRDVPTLSYWRMVRSVNTVQLTYLKPMITSEVDIYLYAAKLWPNPWQQRKDDLSYCRICYRMPHTRLLRCNHCYRVLGKERTGARYDRITHCLVPGCTELHLCMGRCRLHYQRAYRMGTIYMPAEQQAL
jgi:hypothetical protein